MAVTVELNTLQRGKLFGWLEELGRIEKAGRSYWKFLDRVYDALQIEQLERQDAATLARLREYEVAAKAAHESGEPMPEAPTLPQHFVDSTGAAFVLDTTDFEEIRKRVDGLDGKEPPKGLQFDAKTWRVERQLMAGIAEAVECASKMHGNGKAQLAAVPQTVGEGVVT